MRSFVVCPDCGRQWFKPRKSGRVSPFKASDPNDPSGVRVCPTCGGVKHRTPGSGAWYAFRARTLSPTMRSCLRILKNAKAGLTRNEIWRRIPKPRPSDGETSHALSVLCGLKLVELYRAEVELLDEATQKYRYVRKPVWRVTALGKHPVGQTIAWLKTRSVNRVLL